jgi:hypothetical protein
MTFNELPIGTVFTIHLEGVDGWITEALRKIENDGTVHHDVNAKLLNPSADLASSYAIVDPCTVVNVHRSAK